MKALRIAAIGTRGLPSSYSGIERSCEALYTELAARGHEVTVYSRTVPDSGEGEFYKGIRVVPVRSIKRKSIETLSHAAASLYRALEPGQYDVLEFHALAPCVLLQLASRSGLATVARIHGLDWKRAKWNRAGSSILKFGEHQAVRHAHEITVVSRDLVDYFQYQYKRMTAHIPNGMPVPGQDEIDELMLSRLGVSARGYILFFGRLVPEKRVEDLIRAFAGVNTALELLIVGSGGYTDAYVDALKRLGSTDTRVRFMGHLDGPALENVVRAAGLVVFPSELEGLPMALLEALAFGAPVIATDIPPHRELLGRFDDRDVLFRPRDERALQALIGTAVHELEERRRHAETMRDGLQGEYSWPLIADKMEAVYRRAFLSARTENRAPSGNY